MVEVVSRFVAEVDDVRVVFMRAITVDGDALMVCVDPIPDGVLFLDPDALDAWITAAPRTCMLVSRLQPYTWGAIRVNATQEGEGGFPFEELSQEESVTAVLADDRVSPLAVMELLYAFCRLGFGWWTHLDIPPQYDLARWNVPPAPAVEPIAKEVVRIFPGWASFIGNNHRRIEWDDREYMAIVDTASGTTRVSVLCTPLPADVKRLADFVVFATERPHTWAVCQRGRPFKYTLYSMPVFPDDGGVVMNSFTPSEEAFWAAGLNRPCELALVLANAAGVWAGSRPEECGLPAAFVQRMNSESARLSAALTVGNVEA